MTLNGFETVGAKQCRLGCSHEAVRLYCEIEGEAECSDWSNRKNGDTEDGREIIIRDEDDKDLVRYVFACTARFQWRTQEFFFGGGGWGSTNSVEDRGQRGRGSGGGSPLVRGSRGSCNLVQEISFHIVKFS